MRHAPQTLLSAALLATGIAFAACADEGLPNDAVAQVGDAVITKGDFERALRLSSGDGDDSPGRELENKAMETLIKDEWIRQEAEARNVTVTEAEVQAAVDEAKQAGLLSDKSLELAGTSEAQILPTVRRNRLRTKVTAELTEGAERILDRDIGDYYARNKAELIVDERRDVRLVVTKTRARIDAARAALDDGQSWEAVAREYSVHPSGKQGGKVEDVRDGDDPEGLEATIFRARERELSKPVEERGSWAVFVVERIKPAYQAPLKQARDEIRELLSNMRRQRALAAFTKKYKAQTMCAPGYRVPSCRNGPEQAGSSS